MLIDEVQTRELLCRIVRRLTADASLGEDLLQEALLHLWLLEEQRPGQSRSWYLQGCKYHLQNYMSAGKSIDSPKRKQGKLVFSSDFAEIDDFVSEPQLEAMIFAQISARDIISQLSSRLTAFEQSVLFHLAEGLRAREIAARLNVSHTTVIKHRRKIAAVALKMGIPRLPQYKRDRTCLLAKQALS
jgi:DNA-directed RNA polymerase specialized sigma24 family protein